MKPRRIAILMHELDNATTSFNYYIRLLAEFWRLDGHAVALVFGTKRPLPADVLIVHVDLSVVPDEYIEFSMRYPIVLNGHLRDIRKSTYSTQLLTKDSSWAGAVIVKTDRNSGGLPERLRGIGPADATERSGESIGTAGQATSGRTYTVYESLRQVPEHVFDDPQLIVERFRPEMDGGLYCVRLATFLGDKISCVKIKARSSLVKAANIASVERVDPHPEILAARESLHCDYGKFDYVVPDGEPILLDVNKTLGLDRSLFGHQRFREESRDQARGLYSYF